MTVKKNDPIAEGLVAGIYYTLKNDAGEVLDSNRSGGRGPLAFLTGAGNIVPGLEEALLGKKKGDRFTVDVPPEKAYGLRKEELIQAVPRTSFPPELELEPGRQLRGRDANGNDKMVVVVEVGDEEVKVDENHPIAGATLHFDVEVVGVREATAEERQHRHAHGKGGHHH